MILMIHLLTYDADKDKYLVLGREEIKQLDLVKGKYENK